VPTTLNQWCRIVEDDEPVVITTECAGLLPGSTSTKVMQHIEAAWKREAEVVAMVRAALGAHSDELVPPLHGGVHISTLNGSMHDTCNTANLVAQKVCSSALTLKTTHPKHEYPFTLTLNLSYRSNDYG
jgi:hypothetical protein